MNIILLSCHDCTRNSLALFSPSGTTPRTAHSACSQEVKCCYVYEYCKSVSCHDSTRTALALFSPSGTNLRTAHFACSQEVPRLRMSSLQSWQDNYQHSSKTVLLKPLQFRLNIILPKMFHVKHLQFCIQSIIKIFN